MKQSEILFFLGSVCVIVFAWIAFSVLHTSLSSTINNETNQIITPIDGKFDVDTINAMGQRNNVLPLYTISSQDQAAKLSQNTNLPQNNATTSAQTINGGQ